MKKLQSLRTFLLEALPAFKKNPDKLLTFAENGSANSTPRTDSLSTRYDYTATIILTDYSGTPESIIIPINAWLKANYPDRADDQFLQFNAEVIGNDCIDLELKVPLTESVIVTKVFDDAGNDTGTVTCNTIGDPIFVPKIETNSDPLKEWENNNGL